MSDLIDRQETLDALDRRFESLVRRFDYDSYENADEKTKLVCDGLSEAEDVVMGMDTAVPDTDLVSGRVIDVEGLDEQIRCEMCVNPMHTNRGCDGNCRYNENLYKRIIQILDERIKPLSSAQPKKGKWILDRSGAYCCSECMEPCAGYVMMKPRDKFCKMCGAKMEGADDE